MTAARIFVVEDQALVARDIQTRLISMGYDVLGTASRASDAVSQVLELMPDLVLMDINLKGEMDGIEAAARITEQVDVPIIYCTAYSNEATLARAKITAPYGYVLKPFDNRELEINIEISLHKHQMEQQIKLGGERLAATLASVPDGIFSMNTEGEVLFANQAACELVRQPIDDVLGTQIQDIIEFKVLEAGSEVLDLSRFKFNQAVNEFSPLRQQVVRDGEPVVPVEVSMRWFDSSIEPRVTLMLRDITRQLEQEDAVLRSAYFDSLTLLPNRTLFLDRVENRLANAGYFEEELIGIAYLRIAEISEVRQGYGSSAGDEVINEMVSRWQPLLLRGETLAHFGGGEFGLLMSGHRDLGRAQSLDPASSLARDQARMLALLEALIEQAKEDIRIDLGHQLNLSARVGISVNHRESESAEQLLRNAESAQARASESVPCVLFDQEMHLTASNELALRNAVHQAIQTRSIEPFFQPIVRLDTRKVVGFEALARWHNEGQEVNSPGTFIPAAERSGLIGSLGNLMLYDIGAICERYAWLREHGLSIAVNIAASQFDDRLIATLSSLAAEYPAIESVLSLEITEGTAMSGSESTLNLIRELRNLGFRVSVDDFGTGYSSLSYLKQFPLDTLKIDRSFITGLQPETDGYVIVKAIIDLAKALGLPTVAEGIETEQEMDLLRALGCDFGQGFYFQAATRVEEIDHCYKNGLPLGRTFTA